MKLTVTLNREIIKLLTAIAEKKGEVKAYFLNQLEPASREKNTIESVYATIYLQNRSLEKKTAVDILQGLSINAPSRMMTELKNTMRTYKYLSAYHPFSQEAFKHAYRDLSGIPDTDADYRKGPVHLYHRSGIIGLSVPVKEMRRGMKELFHYLRHGDDPLLVKSSVFHYAIHFYQPFETENEKMGRLWQSRLLMEEHPFFEFLPWEKEIISAKKKYYSRLPGRDLNTNTSEFVKYILEIIHDALNSLLASCRKSVRPIDRIQYFYTLGRTNFTRKDYMLVHKNISNATASRDLEWGVETGFFEKHGEKNQTTYTCALL